MMDRSQRKEQFSHAYVRAVASAAGFSTSTPDVDDDSIDMAISGRGADGTPRRPRIELQLKCTSEDRLRGQEIVYNLKRKNYDELRLTELLVPRLLIVVRVPSSDEDWIQQTESELLMRHCGYWVSLHGEPETSNPTKIAIRLHRENIFDVARLRALMGRAARKELL